MTAVCPKPWIPTLKTNAIWGWNWLCLVSLMTFHCVKLLLTDIPPIFTLLLLLTLPLFLLVSVKVDNKRQPLGCQPSTKGVLNPIPNIWLNYKIH